MGSNTVEAADRSDDKLKAHVTVVRRADCFHGPLAIVALKRLADELGIPMDVEDVLVQTDEEARAEGCLGSPTVFVGGQDVELGARGRTSFGIT